MTCSNCGAPIPENTQVCSQCGHEVSTEAVKPARQPQNLFHFIIPLSIVAILVVIAFVVVVFMFLFGVLEEQRQALNVSRAVSNLSQEIDARLSSTPFQALGILIDSMEHGTVNVNLNNRMSGASEELTLDAGIRLSFNMSSNSETGEYAIRVYLEGDRATYEHSEYDFSMSPILDVSALVNRERIAVRVDQFGEYYYGFWYDSFREDFAEFAEIIWLSQSEADQVADAVEEFARLIRNEQIGEDLFSDYIAAFTDFFLEAEQESESVSFVLGENTVQARRIQYTFTGSSVSNLLRVWLEIFAVDELIWPITDAVYLNDLDQRDDIVQALEDFIEIFEEEVQGQIALTFYIGAGGRLLRLEADGSVVPFSGDAVPIAAYVDFGAHFLDTWRLNIAVPGSENGPIDFIWSIDIEGVVFVNTFEAVTAIYEDEYESFAFISYWNGLGGNFNFSYREQTQEGEREGGVLSGVFLTDGESFTLNFSVSAEDEWFNENLTVEISTESTPVIGDVEFVNVSQWGEGFLHRVVDFILDFALNPGFGF